MQKIFSMLNPSVITYGGSDNLIFKSYFLGLIRSEANKRIKSDRVIILNNLFNEKIFL